jgi:hypothetical protein
MTDTLVKTPYTESYEFGNLSSNIDAVLYDDVSANLYVLFKNGNVAGYKGVPRETYTYFIDAISPGRFYNARVKGKFTGVHVEPTFALRDFPTGLPEAKTNLADHPADYGFIYTYEVDVEVTRVEKVQVEAKNVQDALAQAKVVGNPIKISWEL